MPREDCAGPIANLDIINICDVVDAREERDTMTADVNNYFIQALMPNIKYGKERVMMNILGELVDMLVKIDPVLYVIHGVYERGRKVLNVQVLCNIYGKVQSILLW